MTLEKVAATLFKTTFIVSLCSFIGSVVLFFAITLHAEARVQELDAMSRESYMCAAGSAATWLVLLSLPAGAFFGFCLGGFFIWRKSVAERRPLP
ncbi:MAG TPA: hypothetical protein VJ842_19270 [Pyrinomonadaceae bacterium]|nr:hypothetical protein [Pyrinomonadaceae bacterium]